MNLKSSLIFRYSQKAKCVIVVVALSRAWYPPKPGMLLSCEVQDPSKLSSNFVQSAVVQDRVANKLVYREWSGVWLSGKAECSHLCTMVWLTVLLVSSLLLKRGFPLTCLSSQAHAGIVEKCGISAVFSPQPVWFLQMREWVLICICSSEWLCKLIWFFQSQSLRQVLDLLSGKPLSKAVAVAEKTSRLEPDLERVTGSQSRIQSS